MTEATKHKLETIVGITFESLLSIEDDRMGGDIGDLSKLRPNHIVKLAKELQEDMPNIFLLLANKLVEATNDSEDVILFNHETGASFIGTMSDYNEDTGIAQFTDVFTIHGDYIADTMDYDVAHHLQVLKYSDVLVPNDIAEIDYDSFLMRLDSDDYEYSDTF